MMNLESEFTVTEDHLKLVKRSHFSWRNEWGYDGAPGINEKRPYGNSDVVGDIIEILGWKQVRDETGAWANEIEERALKIHLEMATVFQISACTLSFERGVYRAKDKCDNLSWEKVA